MAKNSKHYKVSKYHFRSDNSVWCTSCKKFVKRPHDQFHIAQLRTEAINESVQRQIRVYEQFILELGTAYGFEFMQAYEQHYGTN